MGCRTDGVLTMGFTLPESKYETDAQRAEFFAEFLRRARAVPGVKEASIVSVLPGAGHFFDNTFHIEGEASLPPGQFRNAVIRGPDPDYFAAMHIPLKRGRIFKEEDHRAANDNAMVITESMARKFFDGEDPIGKQLKIDWEGAPRFEIVGIVGDVLSDLDRPVEPTMHLPLNSGRLEYGSLVVMASAGRDLTALALPMQKVIAGMNPDLAVSDVLTMDERIGKSTESAMFDAVLVLLFAVMGLVLAAVGLYGLLSYLVTERTNEIDTDGAGGAARRSDADYLSGWIAADVVGIASGVVRRRRVRAVDPEFVVWRGTLGREDFCGGGGGGNGDFRGGVYVSGVAGGASGSDDGTAV